MAKVVVELDHSGIRQLLQSKETQEMLKSWLADAAGGSETVVKVEPTRAVGYINGRGNELLRKIKK